MALTDTALRALRPKESLYKVFDGGGPYIEIAPGGSRIWRVKYRFEGREKRLRFGKYPVMTLQGSTDQACGSERGACGRRRSFRPEAS